MLCRIPRENKKMNRISKKRIDRPFFSKIRDKSTYFDSDEEFFQSIIEEIENILSSNLKLNDNYKNFTDIPFAYGTRDLQSIDLSNEGISSFRNQCRNMILQLEPRLSDIEFSDITINKEKQSIKIQIICYLKTTNKKFNSEINILI